MNQNDIITVYNKKGDAIKCVLLCVIKKNNNEYIVYKDVNNYTINNDLLASKIKYQNKKIILEELDEQEWFYIEKEYTKLVKN